MVDINSKSKLNIIIKSLFVIIFPSIFYWKILLLLANEVLNNEMSSHILAVPFIIIYILYRLRNRFIVSVSQNDDKHIFKLPLSDIFGICLFIFAFFLSWYGSYTFYSFELNIISIPILVSGMICIIFNIDTLKTLLFPVSFLLFLVVPPINILQTAGVILSDFSSRAAYNILAVMRLPVSLRLGYGSPVIYLNVLPQAIPFAVDLACSGLYSLMGYTVFAVFVAYIAQTTYAKKLSILLLGLPIIYMLNITRIVLIIFVGYNFGSEQATNMIHLFGGWALIFLGTLLILTISNKLLKIELFSNSTVDCSHINSNPSLYCSDCGQYLKSPDMNITKIDGVKLVSLGLVLTLLFFFQIPLFSLSSGSASVLLQGPSGQQLVENVLPDIEDYDFDGLVYRDYEFQNLSGQDASLMYVYYPKDTQKDPIWVGLEIAQSKGELHPWEVCLITWPTTHGGSPQVQQIDLEDIFLLDNPPLPARYFVFKEFDMEKSQVVLYWYIRSIFETARAGYQEKWVKISIIEYSDLNNYVEVKQELLPIALAITNYWKPITEWSWAALFIAQNGVLLLSVTFVLVVGVLLLSYYFDRIKAKRAKKVYMQISDEREKYVFDSIKLLENDVATTKKIMSKYEELTGENVDEINLVRTLSEAEQVGIIYKKIINIDDIPYITWKKTS